MIYLGKLNTCRQGRGFTLTEIAIVLGVMGVIMGGLWQLVDSSWENARREQTAEAIVTVVNNVRQLYGGQLTMNAALNRTSNPTLITTLIQQQVIPSYLLRLKTTQYADTPFGYPNSNEGTSYGTFQVCGWVAGQTNCDLAIPAAGAISFAVKLVELDAGACIQLAGKFSSSSGPAGLLDININGSNIIYGRTLPGTGTLPVATTDLNALCVQVPNSNPNGINTLAFIYRLNPPQQ